MTRLPAGLPSRAELSATPFLPANRTPVRTCRARHRARCCRASGRASERSLPRSTCRGAKARCSRNSRRPRVRGRLPVETGPGLDGVLAEVAAGRPVLVLQRLGRAAGRLALRSRHRLRQAAHGRCCCVPATTSVWTCVQRCSKPRGNAAVTGPSCCSSPAQLPARPDLDRYMQCCRGTRRASRSRGGGKVVPGRCRHAGRRTVTAPRTRQRRRGARRMARSRGLVPAVLRDDPSQAAALNNRAEALRGLAAQTPHGYRCNRAWSYIAAERSSAASPRAGRAGHCRAVDGLAADPTECSQFAAR